VEERPSSEFKRCLHPCARSVRAQVVVELREGSQDTLHLLSGRGIDDGFRRRSQGDAQRFQEGSQTDVGSRSDVILPIGTEPLLRGRDSQLDRATTSPLLVMARLKDGETIASAEQALRSVQPQIREATMPASVSAETRARHLATPFGLEPAA
jgi:hypothetical protein